MSTTALALVKKLARIGPERTDERFRKLVSELSRAHDTLFQSGLAELVRSVVRARDDATRLLSAIRSCRRTGKRNVLRGGEFEGRTGGRTRIWTKSPQAPEGPSSSAGQGSSAAPPVLSPPRKIKRRRSDPTPRKPFTRVSVVRSAGLLATWDPLTHGATLASPSDPSSVQHFGKHELEAKGALVYIAAKNIPVVGITPTVFRALVSAPASSAIGGKLVAPSRPTAETRAAVRYVSEKAATEQLTQALASSRRASCPNIFRGKPRHTARASDGGRFTAKPELEGDKLGAAEARRAFLNGRIWAGAQAGARAAPVGNEFAETRRPVDASTECDRHKTRDANLRARDASTDAG